MIVDQFSLYQAKVKEYLEEHTQVMQKHAPGYVGYRKDINDLARPFIDGYFTLAVVGKMSAGKSTFINALIEDKNILPTDHFQTTCTLTKIRHGESKQVSVTYADGTTKAIKNNIEAGLKQLVAIPEEYRDLPINQINNLIIEGLTAGEIVSKLELLEEKAAKNINVKELKEYINSHHKGNIATEVIIELPLAENYRGWQIIDTPGVDAIGGIEDTTNNFLKGEDEHGANNVDAVIFVHSGKWQIEDGSFNSFVKRTYNSLTDYAKKRMFFVITHASDYDFINHKEVNIENAIKLFVDYEYGFKKDRLVCVDSLLSLLHTYIRTEGVKAESIRKTKVAPVGWTENEWKACRSLVRDIIGFLEDEGKEENSENILNLMESIAGFSAFRALMNDFVRTEKEKAFSNFVNRIILDLDKCIKLKKKDLKLMQAKETQSEKEFIKTIEKEKRNLAYLRNEINSNLNELREDFPEEVRRNFKLLTTYYLTEAEECFDVEQIVNIANAIEESLKDLQKSSLERLSIILEKTVNPDGMDLSCEPVDCRAIISTLKAEAQNTVKYIIQVEKDGFWASVGRFWGTGGYKDKYEQEKHLKELKEQFILYFRFETKKTFYNVLEVITKSGDPVSEKLKENLVNKEKEYSELLHYGEGVFVKLKSDILSHKNRVSHLELVNNKIKKGRYVG